MDFERLHPGTPEWTAYIANHEARYAFAAGHIGASDRRVLDVACGVGYGARHLAERTRAHVTAVDRDPGALAIARDQFVHPQVEWRQAECPDLQILDSESFDAIVSLETLEHLDEQPAFLARCASLLNSGGQLIVSTPNPLVSGNRDWTYHVHEPRPSELVQMMRRAGLEEVRLFGQSLNAIGRLRREVRAEMQSLRHNPLARLGFAVQGVVRGLALQPALPERADDFEFIEYATPDACESAGADGPFVVLAVGRRP